MLQRQHARTFIAQVALGAIAVVGVALWQVAFLAPAGFGFFIGLVYSGLMIVSSKRAYEVSAHDPEHSMLVIAASSVLRFVLIAVLLVVGIRYWQAAPIAIVIPFLVMLLVPFLLLVKSG